MRAFPCLSKLFETWKDKVESTSNGNVQILTCRQVTRVKRTRDGVRVWSRETKGTSTEQQPIIDEEVNPEEKEEFFDEIIIATDADAALKLLKDDAGWMEKKVLGNVKVYSIFFTLEVTLTLTWHSTCGI